MNHREYPASIVMELGDLYLMAIENKEITCSGALTLVKSVIKETVYLVHELDVNQVVSDEARLQRFIDIVLDTCEYIDVVGPRYNDENIVSRDIIALFLTHLSQSDYAIGGRFPYSLDRVGTLLTNGRGAHLPFYFVYQKVLDYAQAGRSHRRQYTFDHQQHPTRLQKL